jgi:hypothetical protein
MPDLADRLRQQISTETPLLRKISDDLAGTRPGGGEGWSRKQELGHLLDSATNNRVRFVRAALEGSFDGPSYNPDGWVAMGGYPEASWHELVQLWSATNVALASVVDRIPEERLGSPCRIGQNAPVTLEFLIDDYILHAQHHIDHVLARDKVTAYPRAAPAV